MRKLFLLLMLLGGAGIVGGVGLFGYILFIHPAESPPFVVIPNSTGKPGEPSPAVAIERDGFAQVGVRFRGSSEYYRVPGNYPHYRLSARAKVVDADGRVLFEASPLLEDKEAHKIEAPPVIEGDRAHGVAEHRLAIFPVRAGMSLSTEADVFHREPKAEDLIGESDVGEADDVEWFLLFNDHDVEAELTFRADGPTYGLEAAGIGLLLLVIGGIGRGLCRAK